MMLSFTKKKIPITIICSKMHILINCVFIFTKVPLLKTFRKCVFEIYFRGSDSLQ